MNTGTLLGSEPVSAKIPNYSEDKDFEVQYGKDFTIKYTSLKKLSEEHDALVLEIRNKKDEVARLVAEIKSLQEAGGY